MSAINDLWATIESRKGTHPESSWTAKILSKGPDYAAKKFGEEAVEAVIEVVRGDKARLTSEAADVIYHLLVMLAASGVSLGEVEAELTRRTAQSGLAEKQAR